LLNGVGLTCQATAPDINKKVILGLETKGLKRGLDRSKIDRVVIEIVVTRTAINGDSTGSRNDANAGNGGFTASRSPVHNAVG